MNNFDPYNFIGGYRPQEFKFNTDSLDLKLRTAQSPEKQEDPIKEIIQNSIHASCTVFIQSNMKEWTGSGFHVGNGMVVTAGHVAPAGNPIDATLSFDGKTLYAAQLVVSDDSMDVAILYCPDIIEYISPVILGDSDTIEIGDIIATITSPEGWNDTATVGRVSNIHQGLGEHAPSQAWNDIMFIDADIMQGSSGGMVIGTDGLVYGSVVGVTGQNAEIGLGQRAVCPSNKIKSLLESLKK